ncbi:hypothetical protein ACFQ07_30800 [Actinomadura adrarensis]|uniref:Uncharacterized protein n=1 Tax=Actinomadura adrarensis TaxID=1819600 RepID=A0ABW3CQJ7_9ACTN
MRDDHPTDWLVILVEGDASPSVMSSIRSAAQELAGQRPWVVGPPSIVDEPGAEGRHLTGLALSLHTAFPPWGDELDREVDRAYLEESQSLLRETCRISAEHETNFIVEFAGEMIGLIEAGRMDDGVAVGLIGEWERTLNGRG